MLTFLIVLEYNISLKYYLLRSSKVVAGVLLFGQALICTRS